MTVFVKKCCFFQLFEERVTVRVRPQDRELVQAILPTVATKYKDSTGREVNLKIDDESHLSQETTGGVELLTLKNKVKINNTLEARLELIAAQLIPEIRTALFGANVNRKFDN